MSGTPNQSSLGGDVGSVKPGRIEDTIPSTAGTFLIKSTAILPNGAGAGAGTLTNAPTAGNPSKWIPINDGGVTRYIPAW